MNIEVFQKDVQRTQINYSKICEEHNGTISNASFLSAGHMAQGYRNRANNAIQKRDKYNTKLGRAKIFLSIGLLLTEKTIFVTKDYWNDVDQIIQKCNLYADLVDTNEFDYLYTVRENSCLPKIKALVRFVERYGNSKHKILIEKLNSLLEY